MEQWLSEELSRLLDFQVPEDLIQYILSINNESDLTEYMKTLLNLDDSTHKQFFYELTKRKFPTKGNASLNKQQKKKLSKGGKQQTDHVSVTQEVQSVQPIEADKSKKKTKYVNLYSQEGKNAQVVMLKGRHRCECQASKHALVNNCLRCGRVVCQQEGSGPCLFCGGLVCTPEQQREINAKTKSGAKLAESLMERGQPKGWENALADRNRLLEYDRTSSRRTRVLDDDEDHFRAGSVWLSATERARLEAYQQELQDKKHAGRLSKKITFDFAGRQILEDKTIDHEVDEEHLSRLSDVNPSGAGNAAAHDLYVGVAGDRDVAPGVNAPLLQFDPSVPTRLGYSGAAKRSPLDYNPRVQDAELQEMSDTGRCLSMHQPWASLLVDGIKMHEGRTWYSNHRGRLWIASTVKPPDQEVIRAIENQYRVLYPDKQLEFPSFYPTGCLLGSVIVQDCLTQEEYQKKFPDGESDSPYVFICTNPISLRLRFPVKGQHKIYALDKTIHQAAVKCIQKMSKIEAEARAA